jgi:integrase
MTRVLTALPGESGLAGKLVAAVRPEFRAEVLVPGQDDPVLGVPGCAVAGCDYPAADHGICNGHRLRWRGRGRQDLDAFVAEAGPPLRGRAALGRCAVDGCHYGTAGHGLCSRHRERWDRAGRPDLVAWADAAPATGAARRAECLLGYCQLWPESSAKMFCRSHDARWRDSGISDAAEFIESCERLGKAVIDFRPLQGQLRLELQYAVQLRHDERKAILPPMVATIAIRYAARSGASSLLDRAAEQWRQAGLRQTSGASDGGGKYRRASAFLVFARDAAETLRDGAGWDSEYRRDTWRLAKLPGLSLNAGQVPEHSVLRFDRISQPWLRELAKRWIRLRMLSSISVETVGGNVQALTRLSEFLTITAPDASCLEGIDRDLLERFLAWLAGLPIGASTRIRHIGGVHMFLQAIRRHSWDDRLPATAVIYRGDYPRRPARASRSLAEYVMTQLEQPASLDSWPSPEGRLVTLILIRCGLRVSSACTLAFDCLIHDGQGAPYLRYFNTKMKREAAVPIDEQVEAEIRAQQDRVMRRWPGGNPHLMPRRNSNASGSRAFAPATYRGMLERWLAACDIRDEHGQPVHLTPHQWRHTFACRLINRDVPQEVVRVLLDHESTQMTAHYARITDQTVRRRWEEATKVNINGERVTIDPDGPLAQAQWAKTRYSIATQTLPNGYCGLPIQKTCPHANACLTCPVFITGPEFLPELRQQRHRTLTLVEAAAGNGQARVAQMNSQVLANLDQMITELDPGQKADADAS